MPGLYRFHAGRSPPLHQPHPCLAPLRQMRAKVDNDQGTYYGPTYWGNPDRYIKAD